MAKERPSKRRRLSADSEENRSSEDSQSNDSLTDTQGAKLVHSHEDSGDDDNEQLTSAPVISRIKPKHNVQAPKPTDLPSTSIKVALQESTNFSSLNIDKWLVSALANLAIKHPTGIQSSCIPAILKGSDCIGGSRTGSGKTIAFALPIIQSWAHDPSGIYAIVLTPTRELALQIYEQFTALSAPVDLKTILVTGGADMRAQAIAIAKRPHVMIATPGRLADHIQSSGADTVAGLRRVRFVVLDEADRLLKTGPGSMLPDIETCLDRLPPSSARQTLLFTATVTPEVRALKDAPHTNPAKPPLFISEVDTEELAIPATLRQTYQLVNVVHKEKYLHVLLLTPDLATKSVIIFCNRTDTANLLEYMLRALEHRVTALHSALQSGDRTDNLARFRAGAARILVATDVAARGLDVPEVGLVVNYDLPRDPDDYIHRVGRTARAGRDGTSISLVGQRDVDLVLAIEERVGAKMEEYVEEGVSVETRVLRDALNVVGDKKREAMLAIEEGRDVKGNRRRGYKKMK